MTDSARAAFHNAFERSVENLAAISHGEGPGHGVYGVEASTRDGLHNQHRFTTQEPLTDLRSVSKVVVAMAVGAAIDRAVTLGGVALSLDMPIAPFFHEYVAGMPAADAARFRRVELRHLMSNTVGHREGFLFRKDVAGHDDDQLLDYIFSKPVEFEPGEHFSYSNVGWYLISAMVARETDVSIADWARDFVLKPVRLADVAFKRYGRYEIAASGVCMTSSDLHRLARLLAEGGIDEGRQIVSPRWVREMMADVYITDDGQDPRRVLQYCSYGLGLWSTADGWHYCDGSAGQLLAVKPATGLAVSAVGDSPSVTEVVNAMQPLLTL